MNNNEEKPLVSYLQWRLEAWKHWGRSSNQVTLSIILVTPGDDCKSTMKRGTARRFHLRRGCRVGFDLMGSRARILHLEWLIHYGVL